MLGLILFSPRRWKQSGSRCQKVRAAHIYCFNETQPMCSKKRGRQRLADRSSTKSVKAWWSMTNTWCSTQKPKRRAARFPAPALPLCSQPLTPINQVSSRSSSRPDLKNNLAFDAMPLSEVTKPLGLQSLVQGTIGSLHPPKILPPVFPCRSNSYPTSRQWI